MKQAGMSLALLAGGLLALALVAAPAFADRDCNAPPTGLVPLNDLGSDTYQGQVGGLYPAGSNAMPPDHLSLGLERANHVVPRDQDGTPDPSGVVVMISIGVSNTMAEFNALKDLVGVSTEVADDLVLVNGAQVGRALGQWASRSNDSAWSRVNDNLANAGVTAAQVQVAWIMLPPRSRGPATLEDAHDDIRRFVVVLQTAKERYPNLELAYLSRIYGGYIDDKNSEPNAYNHGFEIKWLIEAQLTGSSELNADPGVGSVVSPWIAWGPYLWADGATPRNDGLVWRCDDFAEDGVHPGTGAVLKVASLLLEHFKTDPTARSWFLAGDRGFAVPATTTSRATVESSTDSTAASMQGQSRPDQDQGSADSPDPVRQDSRRELAADSASIETLLGIGLAGVVLGAVTASSWRRQKTSGPRGYD